MHSVPNHCFFYSATFIALAVDQNDYSIYWCHINTIMFHHISFHGHRIHRFLSNFWLIFADFIADFHWQHTQDTMVICLQHSHRLHDNSIYRICLWQQCIYAQFSHTTKDDWDLCQFTSVYNTAVLYIFTLESRFTWLEWQSGTSVRFAKPFYNSLVRINGVMSAPHSSHDNNRHRFAIQFNSIDSIIDHFNL